MKKLEVFRKYQELVYSGEEIIGISINIHMGEGEEESTVATNAKRKLEYIDNAYDENLVHRIYPDVRITNLEFITPSEGMFFEDAFQYMREGAKVKLPSWGGYWYWDKSKKTIMIHTKDGKELDIRETDMVEYTLENIFSYEWIIADKGNCPELGGEATFSFGEAIKHLKRGLRVSRKGWNGKNQYIELAQNISYVTPGNGIVNCEHDAIGNQAIAFVGTSGVQMGWLASQADMLADDWVFADGE